MARQLHFRRVAVLAILFVVAFIGLGYRLVHLQVIRHQELKEIAEQNTHRRFLLEPKRGKIVDASGTILAASTTVKLVVANPVFIGDRQPELARILSPLLDIPEDKLIQQLTPRLIRTPKGDVRTNQFVKLKQKVPVEKWEQIRTALKQCSFGTTEASTKKEKDFVAALRSKAIEGYDQQMRDYPHGQLAAHLLGFTNTREFEIDGMDAREMFGAEGLEAQFDKQLRGVPGWRVTEFDRRKNELVTARNEDVLPQDGLNVVLTIDSVLQHQVESVLEEAFKELSPVSISAVMVRPATGEVLAMATIPTFDPNQANSATPEQRRNRVITDPSEPGSTFKIVTVSGALHDRKVKLGDRINCEGGAFSYANNTLRDHHRYDVLTVEEVIAHSSNIGAAKMALMMGPQRLYQHVTLFGFGTRTGIPLPGEAPGLVRPVKDWDKLTIVQMPMGYAMTCTRLQTVMAMCAIANGGWLMRPMLVQRVEDSSGRVVASNSPERIRKVISLEASKSMTEALKGAVSEKGTAAKAMLEGYTVAGKTGTAKKVENKRYVEKYFSSFIGFFPADSPEVCLLVTIDEPPLRSYYGGQSAAPIFKKIAEQTANSLNIRPDLETDKQPGKVAQPGQARPTRVADARYAKPETTLKP